MKKKGMNIYIGLFSSAIILIFILFLEFSCKWWKMWRLRWPIPRTISQWSWRNIR